MAGLLLHSPADILRQLLVNMELGNDPPSANWPVYATSEPNTPDNLIVVTNGRGSRDFGRSMIDGHGFIQHGISIRVRATVPVTSFRKARQIALNLDRHAYEETVTIDGTSYLISTVSRTSTVSSKGKESSTSKRTLYIFDASVALKKL